MAFFRALESARPAHERLFTDPLADRFLRRWGRAVVHIARIHAAQRWIGQIVDRRWPGARTSAVARTRLIDDAVSTAVREGAAQVLLLGAGFDTRAHRLAGIEAARIFEVDQPATQQQKRRVVAHAVPQSAARVEYIPLDFRQETLARALRLTGFDPAAQTVVVWEGVTNYLTAESVDSTFRDIASSVGSRSQILFTYVHAGLLDRSVDFAHGAEILQQVSAAGEPWTFGFEPQRLAAYFAARGMTLVDDMSADEYRARYFGPAADRMTGYSFYRVARAFVLNASVGH